MYHCGLFDLEVWDETCQYALYDDITWEYFPSKKQLLGAQMEFCLTDKYRRKRQVRYGLPWIYTMNDDNFAKVRDDNMFSWLKENCEIVFVEKRLY